jgi:ADP-heptose:LPS heptosyltransferase
MNLTQDFISNVKNILVVGKNNQVGDMICSLPLYIALKKKFTEAQITLVAAKTNYPIPLKDINPLLDNILVYDKSSPKTILNFYRDLRKVKYQAGIVTSTFAYSTTSHIINYLSGAKVRVGVKSINGKYNKAARYLNVKNDFYWDKEKKHQSERNLDVVRQIGCDLTREEIKNIRLGLDDTDEIFAESFLAKSFPDNNKMVFGFHPGAGKKENIWPPEKFVELIALLNKRYNNYILITAGMTDAEIINSVGKKLREYNIPFEIAENFEIKKLAAVLSRINLYITNDTGPMHIAGAVGAKLISLFGPTNAYEWAPSMENQFSIQSKTSNINDINTGEVLSLCNKILAGPHPYT